MGNRYFSATAYAGHLHVQGLPERRPWDSRLLGVVGRSPG